MEFPTIKEFREALKDYIIQEGFEIKRIKNERTRVTCECAYLGCKWRIHASPIAKTTTFSVKSYNPTHTCIRVTRHREATSNWIAKKLEDQLKSNQDIKIDAIEEQLKKKYGLECHRHRLYRARLRAKEGTVGSFILSYNKLPKYAEVIRLTNPGSVCKLECAPVLPTPTSPNNQPTFKRFFYGLQGLRNGFIFYGLQPTFIFCGVLMNYFYIKLVMNFANIFQLHFQHYKQ